MECFQIRGEGLSVADGLEVIVGQTFVDFRNTAIGIYLVYWFIRFIVKMFLVFGICQENLNKKNSAYMDNQSNS